ncbi:hypothetical protein PZA11_002697 [Diplocarpon coronariae]
MAPSKPAVDLNAMINADRTRRKNEILAKEIFGKNRRASATGGGMNKGNNNKFGAVPSLASRIGGSGAGVAKQRSVSTTARPTRPSGRLQAAGNVDGDWTHDLHTVNNSPTSRSPQENPRGPSAARINRNERIHAALNDAASSPSLNSQFNIVSTAKPTSSISIRGLAGPTLIVVKNLASGTTAADLEIAMIPVGGSVLSCRIVSERPIVVAELVFETREGADSVVDVFNNKNADGNRLRVFQPAGPLPAYVKQLIQSSSHAQPTSITQGPRADINVNMSDAARFGHGDDRYVARERSRERRREYSREDVIDGSYGFEDRMETDDAERGLYSDNIISRKGRGIANNRERDNRGDGRQSYR